MIVDVVRYVAARLAHASTGVNALLASVPRPVGDTVPANVTLYNEMDDAITALGDVDAELVENGPALLVAYLGSTALDTNPRAFGGSAQVSVLIRYASANAGAVTFARDGWHTLRAATRALVAPSTSAAMSTHATTTHHVVCEPPSSVLPYAPPPGSATVAFDPALVVTIPAHDRWALGLV